MSSVDSSSPRRGFRLRFSLLGLLVFMTAACLVVFWLSRPRTVGVIALLHVRSGPTFSWPTTAELREWEIVKRTVLAYLKSTPVLQAAVSDPGVAKLPLVSRQANPVEWLSQRLDSQFQQDSEIVSLRLNVSQKDASDTCALLNAVVNACVANFTSDEQQQTQVQITQHEADYAKLQSFISQHSKEIAKLRAERGPEDPEARLLQIEADRQVEAASKLKAEIDLLRKRSQMPPRVRLIQPAVIAK